MGLPQGSWLSPILFNIYIEDQLKELDYIGAFYRAYADDIVIRIEKGEQANNILGVLKDWFETNWIEVNSSKFRRLKIGFKKSKLKEKSNILGIQEWSSYKYLGIKLDQGFTYKEQISSLKCKEKAILKELRKLNFKEVDMKTRKIVYQSIWKQKLTYGIKCLVNFNSYRKYMEGFIYRLIKKCFGIRGNPKKSKVLKFFNINLKEITMEQLLRLRKIWRRKNYNYKVIIEIKWSIDCDQNKNTYWSKSANKCWKGRLSFVCMHNFWEKRSKLVTVLLNIPPIQVTIPNADI